MEMTEKCFGVNDIQSKFENLQQAKSKLTRHKSELIAAGKVLEKKIEKGDSEYAALTDECTKLVVAADVLKIQVENTGTLESLQMENDGLRSQVRDLEQQMKSEHSSFDNQVCNFKEQMQQIRKDLVAANNCSTHDNAVQEIERMALEIDEFRSSSEKKQKEIEELSLRLQDVDISKELQLMSANSFEELVTAWELIKAENDLAVAYWTELQNSDELEPMAVDK